MSIDLEKKSITLADSDSSVVPCEYCGHDDYVIHEVRERMIGTGDCFRYVCCKGCGVLKLRDVPSDIGRFYPENYYSFHRASVDRVWTNSFKDRIRRYANEAYLFEKVNPWRLLAIIRSDAWAQVAREWMGDCPLQRIDIRVLDVGSGAGKRLRQMYNAGYRELTGIDPFLEKSIEVAPGFNVRRQTLADVSDGPFDLVMFHHSLEHMPDHGNVLANARRLLSPRGYCLVRMPVAGSKVHERYAEKWVAWDAPRHVVIHTRKSFESLLPRCGFEVSSVSCDSDSFGYWGSELYERGLSLIDRASGRMNDPRTFFPKEVLEKFDRWSRNDNAELRGDCIKYWLSPV